jgi:hypothetical protein
MEDEGFLLDERSRLGHFNVVGREDAGSSADYAGPTIISW